MIYLFLGLIAGFLLGWILKPSEKAPEKEGILTEPMEEKKANLEKARKYLATREKITNNSIAYLLDISNSTAERYLDELEEEGLIRQIGKTGRSTHYEVLKK